MKLIKGLNRDVQPTDQPIGSWRDARNVVMSRLFGAISNDDGFKELLSDGNDIRYPASELRPIGHIPIENPRTVIFSVDIAGAGTISEIGIMQEERPTVETLEVFKQESIVSSYTAASAELYTGREYSVTITPANASSTTVVIQSPLSTEVFNGAITAETSFTFTGSAENQALSITNSNAGNPITVTITLTATLYYKRIMRDNFLNFSLDYPVSGTFKQNVNGDRIIAFTDDYNSPKILNIDDPDMTLSISGAILESNKQGLLNMFVDALVPQVNAYINDAGGQLLTGAYWGAFAYELADGSTTNTVRVVNPMYVIDDPSSNDFSDIDGAEANTVTTKSITYELTGLDSKFDKIRFYVIKMNDQILTADYVGSYRVSGTSRMIEYSGTEDAEPVELSEVLIDNAVYSKIKTLETLNNRLHAGNLETSNVLDYQKYANNIKVDWVYEDEVGLDQFTGSSKDSTFTFRSRGFKDDEVYAFYLIPILKSGQRAPAFHIPGRAPGTVTIEGTATTIDENAESKDYTVQGPHLIEDIKLNEKVKYFQTRNTAQSDGTMGFWENQDELYPTTDDYDVWETDGNGGGQPSGASLKGVQVRHHKFPSLRQLKLWGNAPYRDAISDPGASNAGTVTFNTPAGEFEDNYFQDFNGNISIGTRWWITFPSANVTGGIGTVTNRPGWPDVTNVMFESSYTGIANISIDSINMSLSADEQGPMIMAVRIQKRDANNALIETLYEETQSQSTSSIFFFSVSSIEITTNIQAGEKILFEAYGDLGDLDYGTYDTFEKEVVNFNMSFAESDVEIDSALRGKILGIRLSDIYFPDDILAKIQGFEIAYARRTTANQTSIGQSILIPHRNGYGSKYTFENYSEGTRTYDNPFRFHGFDMLASNTNVLPTHLTTQLVVTKTALSNASRVWDFLDDSVNNYFYVEGNSEDKYLRTVKNTKYLPVDNSATYPSNLLRERCLFGEMETSLPLPTLDYDTSPLGSDEYPFYIVNMTIYKKNLYGSFSDQELVSTGKLFRTTLTTNTYDTGNLYGGDTFIAPYSFRRTDGTYFEHFTIPVQGALNPALRHEGENWYEVYYPKTRLDVQATRNELIPEGEVNEDGSDVGPGGDASQLERNNYWKSFEEPMLYNNDYTAINQYSKAIPYDDTTTLVAFPTRIARSEVSQGTETTESWRNFLTNDIYDMPRHRGDIVKLVAYNDRLLIHHEDSLFLTIGSTRIDTSEIAAELGVGDIFTTVPKEILTSDRGYAGSQNMWSSILTKAGYFFVDKDHGKVFMLGDSLNEISNSGLRNFFQDSLEGINDNPFKGDGLIAAYDDKYNRLFLARTDAPGFTYSYAIDLDAWASAHDFRPLSMWNTKRKLYSYAPTNGVYQHNDPTVKGVYYDGEKFESNITVVYNQPPGPKFFSRLVWQSEIISQDNTNLYDQTLTGVTIYTKRQCSGLLSLLNRKNMRKMKNTWLFNGFRDVVIDPSLPFIEEDGTLITSNLNTAQPWWKQRRFEDYYLVAKFVYDNVGDNNLYLYNTDAGIREPIR